MIIEVLRKYAQWCAQYAKTSYEHLWNNQDHACSLNQLPTGQPGPNHWELVHFFTLRNHATTHNILEQKYRRREKVDRWLRKGRSVDFFPIVTERLLSNNDASRA